MADVGISVELTGANKVATDLRSVGHAADSLGSSVKQSSEKMKGSLSQLASVLAGLGIAGLFWTAKDAIDGTLESLEQLGRISRALGVSSDDLQKWHFAAERMGASASDVDEAIKFLNRSLGEMRLGQITPAVQIMSKMGISLSQLKSGALTTGGAFDIISKGLQRIPDQATRTRVALELFGRGGESLLTALNDPAQWNYLLQHFDELGLGINKNIVDYFADAHSKVKDLGAQLENFATISIAGVVKGAEDLATEASKLGDEWEIEAATAGTLINQVDKLGKGLGTDLVWAFDHAKSAGSDFLTGLNKISNATLMSVGLLGPSKHRAPPPPPPPAPKIEFDDLSSGMHAQLVRPLNLNNILDPNVAKAKTVLADLQTQYDALASKVGTFSERLMVEQALTKSGMSAEEAHAGALSYENSLMRDGSRSSDQRVAKVQSMVAAIAEETAKRDELNQKIQRNNDLIQYGIDVYAATRTPLEKYTLDIEKANEAHEKGDLKGEAFQRRIDQITEALAAADPVAKDLGDTLTKGFEDALFSGQKLWKVVQGMARDLGRSVLHNFVTAPIGRAVTNVAGSATGAISDRASRALERGLERVFNGFLDGLDQVFGPLLKGLGDMFGAAFKYLGDVLTPWLKGIGEVLWQFLGELGVMHALHEAGLWAITLWDVAEKWAIAIFEAAASILGFAHGGDMTVTRPTLIMVGERGAERVRVSPLAGRNARGSSPGDGGMVGGSGGGGAAINVFIPQSSVVSSITAGNFARKISRTVNSQNGRTV